MTVIATTAELEACIGIAGLPVKMKVIDFLDAEAARWLAVSPLAFVAFADAAGPAATLAGGAPGFASAKDKKTLVLPFAALDDAPGGVGQGAGVLFLIPGIGETLRVNGRVSVIGANAVEIAVEECFVHCAKALIRSDFWAAMPAEAPDEAEAFLAVSRFLALATSDAEGRADVSPKGDPAGTLIRLQDGVATMAERPGNRLAYGFHNMIAQPAAAAIVMIPGATKVAVVSGRAAITTDHDARAAFVVDGKVPILAARIESAASVVRESRALAAARLWPSSNHAAAEIDPAAVLVAHVKANKTRGLQAIAMRTAVNKGIVAKGLAESYRDTLY
jgi:predicted pyridoxine 5'-phosphate oxidase superfamily flavin-nucleotide-binding protein